MNIFKLPIELITNNKGLDKNIIDNLQLYDNKFNEYYNDLINIDNLDNDEIIDISKILPEYNFDISNTNYLYNEIFQPKNIFAKLSCNEYSKYYTTNKSFLKDNQKFVKSIDPNKFYKFTTNESIEIINLINNIKNESGFIEKYQYLEIPFLKDLNNNKSFLQILSIYNLSSPIINLILPILMIMVPFFILIIQNLELTIDNYMVILFNLFKDHSICKLFTNFTSSSIGEKCGLLFWALLYLYQIYNNCYYCYKFFINIKLIHEKINKLKIYLNHSKNNFNILSNLISSYNSFKNFKIIIDENKNYIESLLTDINLISEYKISISKLLELGTLMKIFYTLHNDFKIYEVLNYSFYLNGFIDNNIKLSLLVKDKKLNECKFTKNKTVINNGFYASLINTKYITNNIDLSNNIVISGPNAAGKTTILKSVLFNIILSQQFGFGCYSSAEINVYDKLFCYLNIPDTNNRDSLFQAEAKVCKNIIDYIDNNENENCLCIFDELYSGTNPDEAINSAYTLLNYLSNKKCKSLLTTHFYNLCELLEKNKNYINLKMKVNNNNNNIEFTYKLQNGISNIKGASDILKKLNYPEEILNNIYNLNNNINDISNNKKKYCHDT